MIKFNPIYFMQSTALIGLLLLATTGSALSQGLDSPTNEKLFEQCVAYERLRLKPVPENASPRPDAMAAVACAHFIAGAWRIYSIKTDAKCNTPGRNLNSVIADYLAFTRNGSFLKQPADMTVFMLLEGCYCKAEPSAEPFCPAPVTR